VNILPPKIVCEKVSLYLSLSVVQIFTIMGTIFQDLHFFGKNCQNLQFFGKKFTRICIFKEKNGIMYFIWKKLHS